VRCDGGHPSPRARHQDIVTFYHSRPQKRYIIPPGSWGVSALNCPVHLRVSRQRCLFRKVNAPELPLAPQMVWLSLSCIHTTLEIASLLWLTV
jgi:hypothetical protein